MPEPRFYVDLCLISNKRLVQCISQFGTSLKLGHFLGGNLDLLLGGGIDTLTGRTLTYAEGTETNKRHLVTCDERFFDSLHSGIKRTL